MDLGIRTETFGGADHRWLGSRHGTDMCRPATIDLSTFTQNTHYPDGYLPAGVLLGQITATGEFGLYSNAAGDGRGVLVGHLLDPVSTAGGNPIGALYEHGRVNEDYLPFPVDSNGKADVAGQIIYVSEDGGS